MYLPGQSTTVCSRGETTATSARRRKRVRSSRTAVIPPKRKTRRAANIRRPVRARQSVEWEMSEVLSIWTHLQNDRSSRALIIYSRCDMRVTKQQLSGCSARLKISFLHKWSSTSSSLSLFILKTSAFIHAKLGLNNCPGVNNQPSVTL